MNKLKEWLYDFCNRYSPCEGEPTVKKFFTTIYRMIRGWAPIFHIRMFLQKVFRKDHVADDEVWEAFTHIAQYAVPRLKRLRETKHGYPSRFSDRDAFSSDEDYENWLKDVRHQGGGDEAWNKVFDHIISALEGVYFKNQKLEKEWYIKHFDQYPYDENETNKYTVYNYEVWRDDVKLPYSGIAFNKMPEPKQGEEYRNIKESFNYGNSDLLQKAQEYIDEGITLFGQYFQDLWD